jgi:type I restriction enzyme, S subunit
MSETPWQSSTLGQIARFRRGVSYDLSTLAESAESARPYLNMKSFHKDGGYNELGLKYFSGAVSEDDLLRGNCLVIANTDVTRDGDIIGAPALVPAELAGLEVVCSHHVTALHLRHECDARFLHHALRLPRYRAAFRQHARGTTVLMLDPRSIEGIAFDRPSDVNEQRQIAEVIDTLDTTLHQTKAIIEKLKQVKQGLLHDLLTRGIDANGELRPPQSQAPHLYKDSPLGWIPREWDSRSLDEVAESIVDGPFGSNLKTEHYVSLPGVRVVRLQNIGIGEYKDVDRAYISDQRALSLARNAVVAGDVLVAALGDDRHPVGRACCYPNGLPAAVNKADCFRLRPRHELAVSEFVMRSLNCEAARLQVRRFEQGVTMQRVNLGNLKRVVLALPALQEQKAACERLKAIDLTTTANESSLAKLRLQKSGLMDDLLTGRVRVTPLLVDVTD